MAVVVQCYHCSNILELDEGFRGGVCRCSQCGSLLQVPKANTAGTPRARPAAPGATVTQPQRPSNPNADPGLSRGQFDPKNQAPQQDLGGSSSGLSRAGRPAAPTAVSSAPKIEKVTPLSGPTTPVEQQRKTVKKNNMLLLIAGGIGVLMAIVIIVIVIMVAAGSGDTPKPSGGGSNTNTTVDTGSGGGETAKPPVVTGPNFATIPLVGKRIVIAVDGASSMQDSIDYVRRAVYKAFESLEPDQRIMLAVWHDSSVKQVPEGFAGKGEVRAVRDKFDFVPARGSSDAAECMKAALALGGDQTIFVTAKFGLAPDLANNVMVAAKPGQRIDALKITAEDNPSPLEAMTKKTNGRFLFVTQSQLEELVRH